jgi:hypothetical protein
MGFRLTDLRPTQVTPITPPGKSPLVKIIEVSRTDTVASIKAQLPAQSSIIGLRFYPSVASDAGTSATVTFSVATNIGVISMGVVDVKGTTTVSQVALSAMPNIESIPNTGDLKISATYAETGTPSTTGGPWKFVIEFVA